MFLIPSEKQLRLINEELPRTVANENRRWEEAKEEVEYLYTRWKNLAFCPHTWDSKIPLSYGLAFVCSKCDSRIVIDDRFKAPNP